MIEKRIKELREARGLSQEDLAIEVGVSRPAITKYESGERNPDINMILTLANFFNVSTDYLLGHHPSKYAEYAAKIANNIMTLVANNNDRDSVPNENVLNGILKITLTATETIMDLQKEE